MVYLLKIVIFHGYVKYPEGKSKIWMMEKPSSHGHHATSGALPYIWHSFQVYKMASADSSRNSPCSTFGLSNGLFLAPNDGDAIWVLLIYLSIDLSIYRSIDLSIYRSIDLIWSDLI